MPYRIGFVMEQTLGHVTHAQNLQQWIAQDPDVIPTWIPVHYDLVDRWARTPVIRSNWTLRASLQARDRLRSAVRSSQLDALFIHTQVAAVFAGRMMARIPTVVSMDATPLNFDSIGGKYNHVPSAYRQVEALKNAVNRRTFNSARGLVTWNEWGKRSLTRDYGVHESKVAVIPPGIDLERWNFKRDVPHQNSRPVRLLFVGGDFRRKGGETLMEVFRHELATKCELDIVTREGVDTGGLTNVRVHHGLGPNAPELMALYRSADVFVFPTFGDSLPIAIMEAMASGLPVVTTSVGAIAEEVEDNVTGFLIEPDSPQALANATRRLVENPELRHEMGMAGRRAASRQFDGSQNYRALLGVCKRCADAR